MVNITANNQIDGLNPEATLRLEKMTQNKSLLVNQLLL